ncbi:MAG: alpha/beta hydrolase [Candidatus Binatia bacterium]|nr:alpha/beta hydrolase [Candidatus Binatia bacterium]
MTNTKRTQRAPLIALVLAALALTGDARATTDPSASAAPTVTPDPMAGITVLRDIAYATVEGEALHLDVYRRSDAGDEPQPVLLFYHGGGWVSGGRRDAVPEDDARMRGRSREWNKVWPSMLPYVRRGLTLVTADYRLAPKAPEPAAIEDAFRALAWIGREGRDHGLDPTRVGLAGVSAGGHLALLVGLTETSGIFFPPKDLGEPRPTIRGVMDFYGVSDVADLLVGPNARPFTSQWIPNGSVSRARRLSPLTYVHSGAPPILIIHGDADAVVPYDQSKRLARALEAAGDRVDLLTIHGAAHGWFEPSELEQIRAAALRFLERTKLLAPQPSGPPTPTG